MTGIDATVVLGLAGKIDAIFADEGTYRAFPLAPVGLKAADLRAATTDPLGAGARTHADLSVLVNELPDGVVWQPDGRLLWNVYGEVLTSAELADVARTPEQEAAYRAAFDLLYVTGTAGLPEPSPATVAYEQHRDAYLAAAAELNNRTSEAETSTDPLVAERWAADRPAIAGAVDAAAAAWAGPGRRTEVDEARRVLRALSTDSPAAAWESYRQLFDPGLPEIYFRTSVDGLSYVPTGYLPSDVTDVDWPRVTVTADELKVLGEQAPAELRSRLGSSADAGVELVTFEYSYVTVSRPWFAPQVFDSHAWQLPDRSRVLSDGGEPPKGECTAYVTGLVLARRITVRRTAQPAAEGAAVPDLGFVPAHHLAIDAAALRLTDLRVHLKPQVAAPEPVPVPEPAPAAGTPSRAVASARGVRLATGVGALGGVRAAVEPTPGKLRSLDVVLAPSLRKSLVLEALPGAVRTPEATPAGSAETTTDPQDVFVLAFQCRRLPRTPDYRPAGTGPQPEPTPESQPQPEPQPEPTPEPGPVPARTWTVRPGDTLSRIAREAYGEAGRWRAIYEANKAVVGVDPNRLKVGTVLTLP